MFRTVSGLVALTLFALPVRAQEGAAANPAPPAAGPLNHALPGAALPDDRAGATPAAPITLEELLQRAQAHNLEPRVASLQVLAAKARQQGAGALAAPSLQVSPGLGGNVASRDEEILFSWPVDVFGKRRAKTGVAAAEVAGLEAESRRVTRALESRVRQAAQALFTAQELEKLAASQVEIARNFRDAAARRAQLGEVPGVQTERAQLELEREELALQGARTRRLQSAGLVNQLTGAAPGTAITVDLTASKWLEEAVAEPEGSLLERRPDVLAARAAVSGWRARGRALQLQNRPSLDLQARRGGVFDAASTSLRAVLSVPLGDFGQVRQEKQAALLQAMAAEKHLELLLQKAGHEVEGARQRLAGSRVLAESYRTSLVPRTLELLRKTQVGYEAGASSYLEVLEAQRATRQIQAEYVTALAAVRQNEVALYYVLHAGSEPATQERPLAGDFLAAN